MDVKISFITVALWVQLGETERERELSYMYERTSHSSNVKALK